MNEIVRSPAIIATEINSFKDQTRSVVLMASVEIGKRLVEVKELLPHGEWQDWLSSNVEYSMSTAKNLMQLFNEYGSNPQALGDLSYTKAVALIGIAKEEREQFVEENDVENMSSRELQKAIKEKKALEKAMKEQEKAIKEQRKADAVEIKELQKKVTDLNDLLVEAESPSSDANEEDIELLRKEFSESVDELAASKKKIKQLEADIKAKPIEAAATVEVIPEEVEKELANLRSKLSEQGDPADLKFKLRFETLVSEFKNLLGTLNDITDPVTRSKYSKAVSGLINKMDASLPRIEEAAEDEAFEKQQVTIFDELRSQSKAAQ